MVVYRYLNLTHGLEALQSGEWKIGRLDELNDIYDCRPHMIPLRGGTVFHADDYLKHLNGLNGLICYSATINDPVIWSHYADKHQGMALGFEFPEGDPLSPHQVQYSSKRPLLDFNNIGIMPEDRNPDKAQANLIDSGFITKHPSWKYEREFRYFVPLDGCRMRGRHYFRRLLWERLYEIVLGAKCLATMKDIDRIISTPTPGQLAVRGGPPVRVYIRQCRMNETSYNLDFDMFPRST